jgi:predicted RNase H-like HicB family nuclease
MSRLPPQQGQCHGSHGTKVIGQHGVARGNNTSMNLTFETEQEDDGRWIAEVPELPGVLAYGATRQQAVIKAEALALRVLAERLENAEALPMDVSIIIAAE